MHREWERTKTLLPKGLIIEGRVEQLYDFGAFISIPGTAALGIIVITSISDVERSLSVDDFPPVGTQVRAVVLGHRDSGQQIELSLRGSDFERFGHSTRPT
jgi:predicted RNA-binding protein with RPS1 domain